MTIPFENVIDREQELADLPDADDDEAAALAEREADLQWERGREE